MIKSESETLQKARDQSMKQSERLILQGHDKNYYFLTQRASVALKS